MPSYRGYNKGQLMDTTTSNNTITRSDLTRIEASLEKLLKESKQDVSRKEYVELLNQMADSIQQLRVLVEFDHEKRLQAIEDFLQHI